MTTHPRSSDKGQAEEARALRYLETQGLRLRQRNYRCRHGEIDLVMDDGESLVFVEVRYRGNRQFASGAESVDHRKQAKLAATALHCLQSHRDAARRPARFDVISLAPGREDHALEWIKNAFTVEN